MLMIILHVSVQCAIHSEHPCYLAISRFPIGKDTLRIGLSLRRLQK